MFNLHQIVTKKKTALPVLTNVMIKNGYCYSTTLDFSLKTNSCNSFKDGLYQLIDNEPFPSNDYSINEFPICQFEGEYMFTVGKEFFAHLKNALQFATKDEMRPALTGVFFDKGMIVGCNGHILYKENTGINSNEQFILDPEGVKLLLSVITKSKEYKTGNGLCLVEKKDCYIIFDFAYFKISILTIDAKYPEYQSVIPLDFIRCFGFNRKELTESVSKLLKFHEATNFKFDSQTNDLFLYSENIDLGVSKRIDFKTENLKPIEMNNLRLLMPIKGLDSLFTVNAGYLLTILKSSDKKMIYFNFYHKHKALIISFE